MNSIKRFVILTLTTTLGVASLNAMADKRIAAASNQTWKAECGSCHVAYPPSLLPADSWHVLMSGLDKHFGVDASVDAKTAAEIDSFLQRNAGRNRDSSAKPILRITETAWFRHEHDEVGASVWKNPKVKAASNCAACHTGAEQGNYSERGIRLPR